MITIPVTEERTDNESSWAEIVEAERPGVSHNDPARAVYPSHLRSVVNSFDGTTPAERLGAYYLRRYMMTDVCYVWPSVAIYHHLSNLGLS